MTKEKYRVAYHLSQVVYFEGNDSLPPGSAYGKLWAGLGRLGDRRILGQFWHALHPFKSKLRRMRLGMSAPFDSLLDANDTPISGGGVERRKDAELPTRDCDFYLALSTESRCKAGDTVPSFLMSISDTWLRAVSCKTMLDLLRDNFESLDEAAPFYGFVDIVSSDETYAGLMFTDVEIGNAPLHRFVDTARWVRATKLKRDQARSIYWGNYFGPRLLEKLGGRISFINQFREQSQMTDAKLSTMIWEFGNGVFVSLCPDPLSCAPGEILDHDAEQNMLWLHHRLCECDAVIGS